MKISVIIPVYKVEKFIEKCVESVLKQTFSNFEVILVDDCSPDNSIAIAQKTIASYNRSDISFLYIAHQCNLGQSAARNTGIKHAAGDYLFFLDSDDYISSTCLEVLYASCAEFNSDMAVGENYIIYPDHSDYINAGNEITNVVYGSDNVLMAFLHNQWYNTAWNKLIFRSFILDNQLFFSEGYIFEDGLWTFKIATKLNSLSIVREPTYNYVIHDNSTMSDAAHTADYGLKLMKIMPLFKDYILKEGLKRHTSISHWYFMHLVVITSELEKFNILDKQTFCRLHSLNYVSILTLLNKHLFSFKEFVAYLYFGLPSSIGYVYFKMISYYFRHMH